MNRTIASLLLILFVVGFVWFLLRTTLGLFGFLKVMGVSFGFALLAAFYGYSLVPRLNWNELRKRQKGTQIKFFTVDMFSAMFVVALAMVLMRPVIDLLDELRLIVSKPSLIVYLVIISFVLVSVIVAIMIRGSIQVLNRLGIEDSPRRFVFTAICTPNFLVSSLGVFLLGIYAWISFVEPNHSYLREYQGYWLPVFITLVLLHPFMKILTAWSLRTRNQAMSSGKLAKTESSQTDR